MMIFLEKDVNCVLPVATDTLSDRATHVRQLRVFCQLGKKENDPVLQILPQNISIKPTPLDSPFSPLSNELVSTSPVLLLAESAHLCMLFILQVVC